MFISDSMANTSSGGDSFVDSTNGVRRLGVAAVDPVQIFVVDYDGDKICLQLADPVTLVCCFQCFVSGSAEKNAPGSGSSWADAFIGCFLICDDILCSF